MSRDLQNIELQFSHFVICPVKQAENTSSYTGRLTGSMQAQKMVEIARNCP
jgi:hypothetical protein